MNNGPMEPAAPQNDQGPPNNPNEEHKDNDGQQNNPQGGHENDPSFRPNINPIQQDNDLGPEPGQQGGVLKKYQDADLYHTMKKIIETKEGRKRWSAIPEPEQKKKKKEEAKPEEEAKESDPLKVQQETNVQKDFKNLFNKDILQNNSYRHRLLHMLVFVIILDCIIWEALCLFMGCCYGEDLIMEKWLSHTICPLIFIILVIYLLLFYSSDYLYKPGIQIMNILLILVVAMFIGFGIYGIIRMSTRKDQSYNNVWDLLSKNTKDFYDSEPKLRKKYKGFMLATSILYLVIGVSGIIIIIFSYQFFYLITETVFDWRPPLRSRLHDDRAQRIIDIFAIYNPEFKKLYEAEHKKRQEQHQANEVNQGIEMQELPGLDNKIEDQNLGLNRPAQENAPPVVANNNEQAPLNSQNPPPQELPLSQEEDAKLPEISNQNNEGNNDQPRTTLRKRKLNPLRRKNN